MKQTLLLLLWPICGSAMALGTYDNSINKESSNNIAMVSIAEDASFNYASASYCQDDADPTPSVTTPGGTFSSTAGLDINATTGEIDLDGSTPGTYTVTYTITAPPDSRTFDVIINAVDDATFNYASTTFCSDAADPTPTTTTSGGTFSSTIGLIINSTTGEVDLDASTPGSYTVTYTTAGACPASSTLDITINATDDPSFNYASASYCQDDADPTPSAATAGGTFSSAAGLVINSTTGAIDLDASTPNVYTITYTTSGACPSNDTFILTINAVDDAGFSYASAIYCPTDSDPTPSVNTAGGTFSAPAGLTINSSTGEIDLSASTPGNYTITYTTSGTCPNSTTFDVTIVDDEEPTAQPAANITCDAFTATWDPVFEASSYEVDVAEDADFTTIVSGYNATATADTFLNITGLTATQTYYYRVRSVTSCGTSFNSDTIAVEVMDIPVAVSNLTGSNPDCNGFNVSWDAVTYASSYLLEVSQDGFATTDFSQSIASTSLSLAVLDQGTVYEYRVTPQNVCGSGPASTETYQTIDVPPLPTNVVSSQVVCDGATITWDEVTEAEQYLVEVSADTFATISSYPTVNDTLIISGLTSATTYAYRIIPGNACGTGDTTTVLTFATDSLPASPENVQISVEHNRATVAWDTIVNADSYTVEVALDPIFSTTVSTLVLDSTESDITGLTPLLTYYVRILADNSCGTGPSSDTITFTTPQDPLVIDSLALVDFYNATDGPNWTDNTNWLSGSIDSWQGVTVTDNRVARLELSNNQLSGIFPTTMQDLTGLDYADFRNNQLTNSLDTWVSNFSEPTDSLLISGNKLSEIASSVAYSSAVIRLDNNQFTFSDLLLVVDSLLELRYAPQATVGSNTNTFRNVRDSYTLSIGSDISAAGNQYVWLRNGVAIDTTVTYQYVIDTLKVDDDGIYTCEVTNSAAPDLTLISKPMTINVQAEANNLVFPEIADVDFGSTPFVLNATASSGLPVYYEAIEGDSLIDLQGDVVTLLGIGDVTIRATQPGDDFHEPTDSLTQQFTINQGTQTIAFTAIEDQDITLTDSVVLVISASSGLSIDFTIEGPAELNGEVLQLLDTGTVTVVATQNGNDYYQQALPVSQSFSVFTSDTIPVVINPPIDSTVNYTITVQTPSSSLSAMASLHKAIGSSFSLEDEKPLVSGSGSFADVSGGYYSLRVLPSDENYFPTYIGNQLTLAQASVLGLTQDTTLTVSVIAKPDTTAQQGVSVGGTLVLESNSGGKLLQETAVANITVYLVQKFDLSVVGYGSTNAQGAFAFPNIPLGDYLFLADYEGVDFLDNQITVTDRALTLEVAINKFITIRNVEEQEPPALITSTPEVQSILVSAYPNPVVDQLTVEVPMSWIGSSVSIANSTGQRILSQKLTGNRNHLSLQSLPAGLYYVRVQNGQNSHLVKIMKRR